MHDSNLQVAVDAAHKQGIRLDRLEQENAKFRCALELIAAPKRPDGTYNRSREACEVLAKEVLAKDFTTVKE